VFGIGLVLIYTSHAYPTMSVSVCLSVTFVHCGHRVQWIPDTLACLDRRMSLLLTDNASPGSSDWMMPGFLVEEGRGRAMLATARPSCTFCHTSSPQKPAFYRRRTALVGVAPAIVFVGAPSRVDVVRLDARDLRVVRVAHRVPSTRRSTLEHAIHPSDFSLTQP